MKLHHGVREQGLHVFMLRQNCMVLWPDGAASCHGRFVRICDCILDVKSFEQGVHDAMHRSRPAQQHAVRSLQTSSGGLPAQAALLDPGPNACPLPSPSQLPLDLHCQLLTQLRMQRTRR